MAARNLALHFKSMNALINANFEDLKEIEDIGDQMAASVIAYFKEPDNLKIIERLMEYGLKMDEENSGNTSIFEGKTFVITGTLSQSREYFKNLLLKNGAKVSDSVSSKTFFVYWQVKMPALSWIKQKNGI